MGAVVFGLNYSYRAVNDSRSSSYVVQMEVVPRKDRDYGLEGCYRSNKQVCL